MTELERARISGLYGVADEAFRPELSFSAKLSAFLEGGSTIIQVRCKGPTAELVKLAREAVGACRGRALCIVDDRPDVALLVGADGVHVGEEDLTIADVRRIAQDRLIVGATVRTLEEARAAEESGADYVGFGPMYPTATKTVSATPRTLDILREVARGIAIPVVAIGGISLDRARDLFGAGARAVAVVSDVLANADPPARARAYGELHSTVPSPTRHF
jgi:thiamine-phosphate pyrophosphorylase